MFFLEGSDTHQEPQRLYIHTHKIAKNLLVQDSKSVCTIVDSNSRKDVEINVTKSVKIQNWLNMMKGTFQQFNVALP